MLDREDVLLVFRQLPGDCQAAIGRRDGLAVIMLDPRLKPNERDAALAHELIHHERPTAAWRDGMPETRGKLLEFIEGMCSLELGVSATEVVEMREQRRRRLADEAFIDGLFIGTYVFDGGDDEPGHTQDTAEDGLDGEWDEGLGEDDVFHDDFGDW